MAENTTYIIIKAKDQASPALRKVAGEIDQTSGTARKQSGTVKRLRDNWGGLAAISAGAGVAMYGLAGQVTRAKDSAKRLQSALIGLDSIAGAFGENADAAKDAARSLAEDGLMTVADSATGLKNLLASGYGLDEAIQLMDRFKDSAAFGRQGSLEFGQAIASATEGIKNGNSILVDNAGVTKNLSNILVDAGYSAQDLSKATDDAGVRQAIFKGILEETNPQVGDAARLAESAAGKEAQMAAQTEVLYQQLGLALQPALLAFLETVTPIIQKTSIWVSENKNLSAGIIITTGVVLGMVAGLGVLAGGLKAAQTVANVFGISSSRSFNGARRSHSLLRIAVSARMIMPAIAVGAALAALALVYDAAQKTKAAVENAKSAADGAISSTENYANQAHEQYKSGKISKKEYRKRINWASNNFQEIGRTGYANATGTNFAAGGRTLVGEHGPELVNLPRGSQVMPAYRTAQAGSHEPSQVIINITGPVSFNDRSDIDYFAERFSKMQRLARKGMA
ncbi:MAG: hypothetical protein WA991_03950 [Ornithinimicrobium sp.]